MRFYLIKLTLYLLIGMVILKLPMLQPLIDGFCLLLAKIVAGFLGMFDAGIERHGNIVLRYTYGYALAIGKECSALEYVLALTAAIIAYPVPIIKRLKAVVVFTVVYQLINLLRLMTLIYAKVIFNQYYFDVFHELFWVFLLSILATGLFLVWARHHMPVSKITLIKARV